jgi:molybdopterin molybdotransferase
MIQKASSSISTPLRPPRAGTRLEAAQSFIYELTAMQNNTSFVSVETALQIMLDSVTTVGHERVHLLEAAGRILYEDIRSDINIPPFDNSAMDGYAVRSTDTKGSTATTPVPFMVAGEIQAGGGLKDRILAKGTAIRIMTGAPVPEGADAVIPVEFTVEDGHRGRMLAYKELKTHENIRCAGEDVAAGQTVLKRGDALKSADIGLLAALNKKEIPVFKKPAVAIISTGDEIVEVGEEMDSGKIRNTNAYTLIAEVRKYNGDPRYLGIARDTLTTTRGKFEEALQADVVISTGGVSMGKYDLVKQVLEELGVDVKIEKIRMKPGKPMIFGVRGRTLYFGLPGNPVSTMVSFIEFVRPVLLRLGGARLIDKPEIRAKLEHDIRKSSERKEFIRARFSIIDGSFHVTATGPQGSGILRSMSLANCLIVIPEDVAEYKKGDFVIVQLINHEEII